MKNQTMSLGIVAGSLMLAFVAASQGAPDPSAAQIAKNLNVIGVKDMEVYTSDADYYARVMIEFVNKGDQAVRLENGTAEIAFATKEGQRRTAVGSPNERSPKKVYETQETITGADNKSTTVQRKETEIRVIDTTAVSFGKATIGENEDAIEFKAAADGKPYTFDYPLFIKIGPKGDAATTQKIAQMANIMGDPKVKFSMKIKANTQVALGVQGGDNWIKSDGMTQVELNLSPSVDQQYLFK